MCFVLSFIIILFMFIYKPNLILAFQFPPDSLKESSINTDFSNSKLSQNISSSNSTHIYNNKSNEAYGNFNLNDMARSQYQQESKGKKDNSEMPGLSEGGGLVGVGIPINYSSTNSLTVPTETKVGVKDKERTENVQLVNNNKSDENPMTKGSVFPRKGVALEVDSTSSPSVNISSKIEFKSHNSTINSSISKEGITNSVRQNGVQTNTASETIILKKPESASDVTGDDAESSSTGKDYVMTGIVIFVCIWAVIFGALFFYKRAGELWDRRHYRRMDFLVEGMYND